jgi:pyruvate,water dikinase
MTQTVSPARLTRWLDDIDETDRSQVGGKAATLGALRRIGLPVPDGYVLTAGPSATLSGSEIAQVVAAARRLGGTVAVRSTAVAEDGPELSYAGQFDSVLDIDGETALITAIESCLAAAGRQEARGYGGLDHQLAILVQRMIGADASGVAFTANPVSGDVETCINAVPGLGNRLTSGASDADEWVVRNGCATLSSGTFGAINAEQACAIAALADLVADHFGAAQDIEWAIADGELFLLQARSITALPIALPADPPPGFWLRETVHAPDPLTPMMRSIWRVNEGLRHAAEEFGLLVTPTTRQIGGWEYGGVEPVGAPPGRPVPPAWVLAALGRVVPAVRRRVRQCRTAVRTDRPSQIVEQWYAQWRPELTERIRALEHIDPSALDDEGLRRHLADTDRLIADTAPLHFLVDFAHMMTVGELGLTLHDLIGWDDTAVFELFAGLSTGSTEPGHRLADLAAVAREHPAIMEALDGAGGDLAMLDFDSLGPPFAKALAAFQQEFGSRALQSDVLQPTIGETPALTLGLLRDQLARSYNPAYEGSQLASRRTMAALAARTALPDAERARFERLLASAQRAYPAREDNEVFTVTIPLGLIRLAALEAGRRLAANNQLDHPNDVFFHQLDQVCAAIRDGTDLRPAARRRRRERAWVQAHPGPLSYGRDPGPPPSLMGFPYEVRHTARVLAWALDRALPTRATELPCSGLAGIAASPGRYRGPVRVVLDESHFERIRAGDILVCRTTSPAWSLVFPSIGALVTDVGGSLSHPAIIAREYRTPAVVATGRATEVLRDGQIVTVDGTTGIIQVHS